MMKILVLLSGLIITAMSLIGDITIDPYRFGVPVAEPPDPATWDIGAHEFDATGSDVPEEFDVGGATYYAVAPAGYSYSGTQDTNYSTRKYNTLFAAEAGLNTSPTTPQVINIIGDWTGISDTTVLDFSGVTTSASNYTLVRTMGQARHQGVWSDSSTFYRLVGSANWTIRVLNQYVRIDGLLIEKAASLNFGISAVHLNPASGAADVRFSNCIVRGHGGHGSRDEKGIEAPLEANQSIFIYNCIVYRLNAVAGSQAIATSGSAGTAYIYSCTALGGSSRGIEAGATGTFAAIAKNCYASGSSSNAYLGTITKTTCASNDATGSAGLQNIAHDATTFVNVTAGSQDYRLAEASPLIDVGTDTSGDAAPLNFTTDIAGKTRQ